LDDSGDVDGTHAGKIDFVDDISALYLAWYERKKASLQQEEIVLRGKGQLLTMLKSMGFNKTDSNVMANKALNGCNDDYSLNTLLRLALRNDQETS